MAGYMEAARGGDGPPQLDQRTIEQRGIDVLARATGEDLDVTVLAFAQWLSDMRNRSTSSVQQMLAEMGIIRNGITSNNADLVEFKRNTATVQQQMQSQIIDLRDKLTDAYSEIANMKKSKIQFEQEMSANYTSLAEQLHFRQMEMEVIKKSYSQVHQSLQDQIMEINQAIEQVKDKIDSTHRGELQQSEQAHHQVAELNMNSQQLANEIKRMRGDYDASIASLSESVRKWNDGVRDLRRDFDDLKKLQALSQQKLQAEVWDVRHQARQAQGSDDQGSRSGQRPSRDASAQQTAPAGQSAPAQAPPVMRQPGNVVPPGYTQPAPSYIVR